MITTIQNVIRVPGRLCYAPADLSLPFPHGGISLGIIKSIVIKPYKSYHKITAEEFGNETVDYIDGGESWILGAILRSYDKNALKVLFPSAEEGAQTQETIIKYPATNTAIRAGQLMSAKAVKLLFSPDDTERNPFAIFYNAIPLIDETAEINLQLDIDWSIGVLFAAIRDSNGKAIVIGLKGDFTL